MIICYDLEDNIITTFDSDKEAAEWIGTNLNSMRSYLSRVKIGELDKKKNKHDNKWYRLYKIEEEEDD